MKHLCESNVFLALALASHPHHAKAVAFMDLLPDEESVYFCRLTQQSFLRLLTLEALMKEDVRTNSEAIDVWRKLRLDIRVGFIRDDPDGVEACWLKLARYGSPAPKRWMDAYLAALAINLEMRFVTFDRGYRQYRSAGLDLLCLE
ncbi:MAG: PIN domain-containing protein [Opitutaceae bacterium]|nr:PIN domain-containing protein [Opitutaceae bacterium]